jgi:hypothetical protein
MGVQIRAVSPAHGKIILRLDFLTFSPESDTHGGMTMVRHLLLLPLLALAAGCEDADWKKKDASGFSKDERFDAMQSGTVLPGMSATEVERIWGKPHGRKPTSEGEEWTYYSGSVGRDYDVHTTVKFAQGKVSEIMNGDLMGPKVPEKVPDLAPNMSRDGGVPGTNSPAFQSLPGLGSGL